MISMDLEDYIEEVKFQMTEWDYLEEEMILEWEDKAREWVEHHSDRQILKKGEDITVLFKDEELPETMARKYYRAIRDQKDDDYWKNFDLLDR